MSIANSAISPKFSLEANASELQSWKTRAERNAMKRSHKTCYILRAEQEACDIVRRGQGIGATGFSRSEKIPQGMTQGFCVYGFSFGQGFL